MNKKEKVKLPKKKLVNRITTIVLGSLAGLLLFFQVFGLITARSNHGVQRFGNYQMLTVLTDSMEPVLPIDVGIIIKRVPANQIKDLVVRMQWMAILLLFPSSDGLIITPVLLKIENLVNLF